MSITVDNATISDITQELKKILIKEVEMQDELKKLKELIRYFDTCKIFDEKDYAKFREYRYLKKEATMGIKRIQTDYEDIKVSAHKLKCAELKDVDITLSHHLEDDIKKNK